MNTNPYASPKTPELDARTPAQAGFRIVARVLWAGLVISLVWNLVGWHLYRLSELDFSGRPSLLVLALVAAAQMSMVLVMRWIFFRFMMRNVDSAGLQGAVRCIGGAVMVYGMIKAMEVVGLRLWFGSGWLAHYYCFAVPGFVLAALLRPGNLEDYISAGQKVREDQE